MRRSNTAEHQLDLIARQIRGRENKAICLCATMWKGGGNNGITYLIELKENDISSLQRERQRGAR